MGFRLKVSGDKAIELNETQINNVEFLSTTPNASNARATELGLGVKVDGKINFSLGAEQEDATVELASWSVLPSDDAKCYRSVDLQVVNAGQVVRNYIFPHAYVLNYTEELDDEEGVGKFVLVIRQKRDLNEKVELKGGFEA